MNLSGASLRAEKKGALYKKVEFFIQFNWEFYHVKNRDPGIPRKLAIQRLHAHHITNKRETSFQTMNAREKNSMRYTYVMYTLHIK